MNIYIICQYFYPEIGAPQARLLETVRVWVKSGHPVILLTGFPNHPTGVIPPAYQGKIFMEEYIDGIRIWRHWLYATPNEGFFKKTIAHISFALSLLVLSLFRGPRPNVYIVSSPNFFSVISTYIMSTLRHVPYIFEVRDLWPSIFVELEVLKNKFLIRFLEGIELFLYKKAALVVPVTHGFADAIIKRGIDSSKVEVITNGIDLDSCVLPVSVSVSRESLNLSAQDFIVLYLGAHGISHALMSVLETAFLTKEDFNIHFMFIGEGAEKEKLITYSRINQLTNVSFVPGKERQQAMAYYRIADVCLVPLRNIAGFESFIPSKMFEIMGFGRPIIASLKGEAATILKDSGSAVIIPPEDPKVLKQVIYELKGNPEKRRVMGQSGRSFVEKYFDRKNLAQKYLKLIEKVSI